MKKQLTEKIVYQPNRRIKVTVTNKPEFDEEAGITRYERKVAITFDCGYSDEKINFADDAEIQNWVEQQDFEDPQLSLLEDGADEE